MFKKVEMQDREKRAQKVVLENARSTKTHLGKDVEYILFYELETGRHISCHTDFSKNTVGVHVNIKELLAQDIKLALHHNHPTGNSLSTTDYEIIAQFPNIVEIWAHVETVGTEDDSYRCFKATVANNEGLAEALPALGIEVPPEGQNSRDFTWALAEALSSNGMIKFETDYDTFDPSNQEYYDTTKAKLSHLVRHHKKMAAAA